ncbi:MAG: hypothetical protein IJT91_09255 [Clostridia bacterium]|nr:hypothetical protein [Clostridia bacterium]
MKTILLSSGIPADLSEKIEKLTGCEVVLLPGYGKLPEPVRSHPDMLVFAAGGSIVTDGGYYAANRSLFDSLGKAVIISGKCISDKYPGDVAFNSFDIDGTLFGRLDSLSDEVKNMFDKKVNVRQGYAKCSTVLLPDGSVITADAGIASAVSANGREVLVIGAGNIDLPGYDAGFIGGASFVYGGYLYFFGDPALHPDGERMIVFAEDHGCGAAALSDTKLFDHGGAVIV